MEEVAITLVRGTGEGAVFALVAMSMNIVFNASDVLNFAQGYFVILGGLFAFLLLPDAPGTTSWAFFGIGITLAVGGLMSLQGYVTLLPLRSSVAQHSWLVTTLAAAAIIESLILIFQGPDPIVVQNQFGTFGFLGVDHPILYPMLIGFAILTFLALRWFLRHTLVGLTMHALRQDLEAARAAGASVRQLQVIAFGISGVIVGATGFLGSPVLAIEHSGGIYFALGGFVAAVIGGLGNQLGALIAGPAIGMVSVLSIFTVGGEFEQTVGLALLIAVLLIRPQGVFGRTAARRV